MNQVGPNLSLSPVGTAPASAPVVIECDFDVRPDVAANRLSDLSHVLLLESSMRHSRLGRYSFLAADPLEWFQPDTDSLWQTFSWLDARLAEFACASLPGLPPFQGGVAGLFGYEFNAAVELLPLPKTTPSTPPVALGVYDVVIAWDHEQDRCWIISQGLPAYNRSEASARERAEFFEDRLRSGKGSLPPQNDFANSGAGNPSGWTPNPFRCPGHSNLSSDFDRASYISTVEQALEYIRAGDIFQVNIAQQLLHPAMGTALDLYQQLRECNPSTFGCYLDLGNAQVVSASPERLVSVHHREIETRPIKGTRRRTSHPEIDIDVAHQLLASEKDRAENVMIVDLMRNDLSRVCHDDSVYVSQFVELESYASVLHLVSAIKGRLREDVSAGELLKAVFPGGSITGAPKIRAMEIIAELERAPRGPYCGSMGYIGFDGSMDLNILIRTITAQHGVWRIPVGGGIVADSDPADEYEETWTKAHGMLAAINRFGQDSPGGDQ